MRNFLKMLLLLFVTLFGANNIALADTSKQFEKSMDIQIDHKWSIKLSYPIDTNSIIPENIFIYDSSGERVFIPVIEFSSDQQTIYISPPLGYYEPNTTYTLEINKELRATNGKKLKVNVKKEFTTESEESLNIRFEKLINDVKASTITFKEAVKQANYNEHFLEKAYSNLTAPLIPENNSEEARQIRNTIALYTFLKAYTQKSAIPSVVDSINKARYQETIEEFIIHKIFEGNASPYEKELSEELSNLITNRITNEFISVGPETEDLMDKIFEPFNELIEQPTNGRDIKSSGFTPSEFLYEVFGIITFADPNLEKVVRSAIRRPTGDIYPEHVSSLENLFAYKKGIKDLEGVQFLTNLGALYVDRNEISNIEPIFQLKNLWRVDIYENNVSEADKKRLKAHVPWVW